MTSVADRLRELAGRLPPGGSIVLTREGLLDLAAVVASPVEPLAAPDEFTVGEVARRFHRSASNVRGWCEHGRFEGAYKLNGRDWRIPQAGVDAFVIKQRSESPVAQKRGESPVAQLGAWRAVRRAELIGRR